MNSFTNLSDWPSMDVREIVVSFPLDNKETMDDMEEADETLMRLWRQGQEDFKELKRRLAGTGRNGQPVRPR